MNTKKFFPHKGAFALARASERENIFSLLLFYAKMLFFFFLSLILILRSAAGVFVHKRAQFSDFHRFAS